jgi:uncharacterized coiled-coil DUF342 family protein
MSYEKTYDFGFTTLDEEEILSTKTSFEEIQESNQELHKVINSYEKSIKEIEKLIKPLLNNLLKNPEKEYIKWPNREEKLKKVMEKLEEHFRVDR